MPAAPATPSTPARPAQGIQSVEVGYALLAEAATLTRRAR